MQEVGTGSNARPGRYILLIHNFIFQHLFLPDLHSILIDAYEVTTAYRINPITAPSRMATGALTLNHIPPT